MACRSRGRAKQGSRVAQGLDKVRIRREHRVRDSALHLPDRRVEFAVLVVAKRKLFCMCHHDSLQIPLYPQVAGRLHAAVVEVLEDACQDVRCDHNAKHPYPVRKRPFLQNHRRQGLQQPDRVHHCQNAPQGGKGTFRQNLSGRFSHEYLCRKQQRLHGRRFFCLHMLPPILCQILTAAAGNPPDDGP